jgi:hypothetical protein
MRARWLLLRVQTLTQANLHNMQLAGSVDVWEGLPTLLNSTLVVADVSHLHPGQPAVSKKRTAT